MPSKPVKELNEAQKLAIQSYNRQYNRNKRHIVCGAVRGTKDDARLIQYAHKKSGLSWLNFLYRAAGLRRPPIIPIKRVKHK